VSAWTDLCNGYGIRKVPPELARDLACAWPCGERRHLYTTSQLTPADSSPAAYRRMADALVGRCYCKFHITELYRD
jgi:hypothetical protein